MCCPMDAYALLIIKRRSFPSDQEVILEDFLLNSPWKERSHFNKGLKAFAVGLEIFIFGESKGI